MSILDGFDMEELTITRRTGSRVNGRWVPGLPVEVVISAVIAPYDKSSTEVAQMLKNPDGERQREPLWIFTVSRVEMADESTGQMADMIERQGRFYKVRRVLPLGPEVYEVTAFRCEPDGN